MRPGNIFPGLIMMHRILCHHRNVQVKKDEVVFTGEIPARCIQAYRTDLAFYTNGQSVCLTELKGYQPLSASQSSSPAVQTAAGQGAPYVSEGNVKIHNRQDGNNQKLWRVTMEYSKEDLMEAKKQIWGVGENMGTEESKKSGRRTHNFGIMQWVTNLMNFTESSASQSNGTSIS